MEFLSVSEARKNLYKLVDEVSIKHEPALIKGKRNNAVLIASEDWEDIQETLYVMQNKQLTKSLVKGMHTSYAECSKELVW
jgi:prevent-host-death family protein